MAGKLTDKDMDQLENWIGADPKNFNLLYSITRDGCVATSFHQRCNNQGPTVTVLYNQQNSVYGGYTSVSWSHSNTYQNDDKAFLYQLRFSGQNKATKFPVQTTAGQFSHQSYGPTFGNSSYHDLVTFTNTVNNSGRYFSLNGSMFIGNAFNNQGVSEANINNSNMNVTELEVYSVTDLTRHKPIKNAVPPALSLRNTPEFNAKFLSTLMGEIETFKPLEDLDVSQYRILMLDPVGSGKSSFYNTISSVFRGRISQRAVCGNENHSTTTAFNPSTQISLDSPEFISTPTPDEKIHCVLFVIDASVDIPKPLVDTIKSFRRKMNQKEIPQVILLTKIDKLSKGVKANIASVFTSVEVEQKVESVSTLLGLPRNHVLPVKNYEIEMQLGDNISVLALLALRQVLYFSEDYMENMLMKNAKSRFDACQVALYDKRAGSVRVRYSLGWIMNCHMDDFSGSSFGQLTLHCQ